MVVNLNFYEIELSPKLCKRYDWQLFLSFLLIFIIIESLNFQIVTFNDNIFP